MRIELLNRSQMSKEIQVGVEGLEDFLETLPEETQEAFNLTEMADEQAHKYLPPIFRYMRESLARIFIDATELPAGEDSFLFIPGVNVDDEPENPKVFPPNAMMLDVDKLAGYLDGTIEVDVAEDIEQVKSFPLTSPTVADLLSFAVVDQRFTDEVNEALHEKYVEGVEIAKAKEEERRESMTQTLKALATMAGMNTMHTMPVRVSRTFEWPKRPPKRERSEAEMDERRARKKANKEKRRARRKKLRR